MTENIYGEFLDRSDCVLLLVDVQKAILDLCVEPARLRKHCAALIEIASIFQIPMVFSQHNPEKLGGFLPELVAMSPEPIVMDKLEFSPAAGVLGAPDSVALRDGNPRVHLPHGGSRCEAGLSGARGGRCGVFTQYV
jgi:nicotinamidase-related amidase